MYERHKMSQREWPYNLWDEVVTERKDVWIDGKREKNYEPVLKGYADDQYPAELYLPNLETVLSDALTEKQKEVVHLRYEQKMSYAEIAETLGITRSRPQTVTREALMRLTKPENFFRLKAVPTAEVRKQIRSNKTLQQKNEELLQQKEELEQQNAKLEERISELLGHRKRMEERRKQVTPDSSIKELHMNLRAYNALNRAGIETVGELIEHTIEDLMKLPRMGKVTVANIMGSLSECGYELKEDLTEVERCAI